MEEEMESYNHHRKSLYLDKATHVKKCSSGIVLRAKIAELNKIKEDIKQAKEDAIDSWSDCRHLIHVLKKLEMDVESANKRSAKSSTVVSELEYQLAATKLSIKSKREEELNVTKMINEINDDLEETQEEMEEIILERDENRREREELKQMLKIRMQTLDTLQLTHRALRLEVEYFGASAAKALQNIAKTKICNTGKAGLYFEKISRASSPDIISKEHKMEDEITRAKSSAQANEDSDDVNARSKLVNDEDKKRESGDVASSKPSTDRNINFTGATVL
ncbi:hypothetical protein POM88_021068 [Heracleum sosnowskyi]|uniref:Uncharacterized protein n=1 Tax=Heracleum sosnowskyi TaxID=360622 RepID=A0AAD8IDT4_9APIA|nr:hypothetical protein POM88_021068 [Heracleum sosnowskyi]